MKRKNILKAIVCVVLTASLLKPRMAEEPKSNGQDKALTAMSMEDLLNVTVSGASKFQQPASEAPASVTVITSDEINK